MGKYKWKGKESELRKLCEDLGYYITELEDGWGAVNKKGTLRVLYYAVAHEVDFSLRVINTLLDGSMRYEPALRYHYLTGELKTVRRPISTNKMSFDGTEDDLEDFFSKEYLDRWMGKNQVV